MKKSILIFVIALVSCQKQSVKPAQPTIEEINSKFDRHLVNVIFWISSDHFITTKDPFIGVDVSIGTQTMTLPMESYLKSEPNCNQELLDFTMPAGTYTWSAFENIPGNTNLHKWSGTITLSPDVPCTPILLN